MFTQYLDDQLFVVMYPDMGYVGSVVTLGPKRVILDLVSTGAYVFGPLTFIWMMQSAGSHLGGGLTQVLGHAGNSLSSMKSPSSSNISKTMVNSRRSR